MVTRTSDHDWSVSEHTWLLPLVEIETAIMHLYQYKYEQAVKLSSKILYTLYNARTYGSYPVPYGY